MRFKCTYPLFVLIVVGLLAASAEAQNRRGGGNNNDRGGNNNNNGGNNNGRGGGNGSRGSSGSSYSGSSGSASPVSDDNADKTSFDRYRVLFEHNIFMKNRARPSTRPTRDNTRDAPPSRPEMAFRAHRLRDSG
jgi:hypothetical protein